MQITVLGANGKVGRLVVRQLLESGYEVVAFVHRASSLPEHPKLKIIQGDIHSAAAIAQAVMGSTAVISTLGSWHTPDKDVLSSAIQHLVPAMRAQGIRRIVSLTGAGAFASGDSPNVFDRFQHILMNAAASKILRDSEEHIRLLSESDLDWTVVRSPVMNERGKPRQFVLNNKRPSAWATIHRQAVAASMIEQIESREHSRQAPFICRG